jgi:hypothetical protein
MTPEKRVEAVVAALVDRSAAGAEAYQPPVTPFRSAPGFTDWLRTRADPHRSLQAATNPQYLRL